jgi:hypothetical protein
VWRARGLEIVGDRDALDPLGPAVGDAHGVSSLAERGFGMLRVRPVSATMAWSSI